MSRPESFDELDDWRRAGHQVATIAAEHLTRDPVLGASLLAALARAAELGWRDGDNIRIPLTDSERDASLTAAQRGWDAQSTFYADAQDDPSSVSKHVRYTVDSFAKSEGLDPIEWPVEAVSA